MAQALFNLRRKEKLSYDSVKFLPPPERVTQIHLRPHADVRGHLYAFFDIKDQLEDLQSPVNDLQMLDMMLRSLPTQMCYNELRRKVLFSTDMSKYMSEIVCEMILTPSRAVRTGGNCALGSTQCKKNPSDVATIH